MSHQEEVFFVNEEAILVRASTLTVREILDDAGLSSADHALFEQRDGMEVALEGMDTPVTLTQGARFIARRTSWRIFVNGIETVVRQEDLKFNEVVSLAKDLPAPGPGVEYIVAYEKAASVPHGGTLIQGEQVRIKNGTEFEVTATNCS